MLDLPHTQFMFMTTVHLKEAWSRGDGINIPRVKRNAKKTIFWSFSTKPISRD